jgi:hypothetical protein
MLAAEQCTLVANAFFTGQTKHAQLFVFMDITFFILFNKIKFDKILSFYKSIVLKRTLLRLYFKFKN